MRKHARRRGFAPGLAILEQRRLMALAAIWIGQDGSDFTGTEGLISPQRPNDYQDIHLQLTGLSNVAVTRITITKPVRGGWAWDSAGTWSNAVYVPNASHPGAGDFYMEPDGADPAGTLYDDIHVVYADGSFQDAQLTTPAAVDPNLRTSGEQVSAVFVGQVGQDWTGPYIGVGPDGFQDVKIALSNLSAGADLHVTVTAATNPPRVWQSGVNPDGDWNAELLNRSGQNGTLGTTADLFFSSDVNLAGVPLTVVVTYEQQNPDGSYTNRGGLTDTTVINAGATNPNLAMPAVVEPNLPQATATSPPQDTASPGNSHAALDAGGLPPGQSFASVRSAVLSNRYGSSWVYTRAGASAPYTGGSSPMAMRYDAATGIFDFPPVRDEDGSTLTLLLTFNDGSQAVARFAGAPSDIGLRVADTRIGASVQDVSSASDLLAALQSHAANIHLKAGSYTLNAPLNLNYPVWITADPGITLTFALSSAAGSPWNTSSGAILVSASHVGLDGFAIRFQGDAGKWTAGDRVIVQAGLGDSNVDLSFTHLDVQAPAASVTTGYEGAVTLMNFDPGDSGVIADDILRGGWIQLGNGPWRVTGNDYQGAVAHTITPTFLNVHTSHDLTISGNHAHQVDPAGIAQRFLVYGGGDSGQGIGNLIEDNTIDGGIGTPADGAPPGYGNSPEIILAESYQPRFEGKPSAVSPDGSIVQVPALRGPAAQTGDVVSILTGPYAGQWRLIAQALSPTRYLLADPLPQGDYVIAIGRGFVDQTYRGNTIDVRGMSAGNIGMVISGNDWGTSIVGNTFLGGNALRIGAGSSEAAFSGPNGAPWGWSRLPVFDLAIDGNLFEDASIALGVSHDLMFNKASSGRTYFTGDLSNNEINWSSLAAPAVTIGTGPNPSTGAPAYIQANFPWLTLDELSLTMRNNWRSAPTASGAVAATIKVYAATINGFGADDQIYLLPTSPVMAAKSLGQDGSDFVGGPGSPTGPDGYQDVHIVLSGLSAEKPITQIIVTGYGGGEWHLTGYPAAYSMAVVRHGATADLYLQTYQNETGRYLTVGVQFADQTMVYAIIDALYATVDLAMPANPAPASAVITARGDFSAAGQGMAQAFDGDDQTKWLDFSATSWIQYQFAGAAGRVINQYTITSADDTANYPGRAPKSWTLKGSNDGVTWTTLDVRTDEANTADLTARTYTFANSTPFKIYRLDDIVSNGDPIIQIAEIQFQGPQPVVDLAKGKTATSSTVEGAAYAPASAVDGDDSTRWSSGQWMQNDSIGWITIDLGTVHDIDRVTLNWEAAFAVDYQIQVSDDDSDWTTVQDVVGNTTGGVLDYTDLSATGRYVRIYCTQVNATKNYSLYDVNVYGV